jgi:DNA excision repair protein ERCC-2
MQTTLFPHDTPRAQQTELIAGVLRTIDRKGILVAHAPTGLGKTAASLAPAIERGIKEDKIVVFVTNRLTQHALAMETVTRIRQRHNVAVTAVDLIGKKHMCLQPGVENLSGREFAEYCKSMREDGLCEFYTRMKTGEQTSAAARSALIQLGKMAPNTPMQTRECCAEEEHRVCPYEIAVLQAKDARVIITDYSYLFNPSIREGFFRRINRELADCILIIDEAHNLPDRVKDLATVRITTGIIRRAMTELSRVKDEEHLHHLQQLQELVAKLATEQERHLSRADLLGGIAHICPVEQLIDDLERIARTVREEQQTSSCGTIAEFLSAWAGEDEGFTRIIAKTKDREENGEQAEAVEGQRSLFGAPARRMPSASRIPPAEIRYRCLDPSIITGPVFAAAHATIIMSGTLTPTGMYAHILGAEGAEELTLTSPFPQHNRLNIVIPKTTTKFTTRSPAMFAEIGRLCAEALMAVPGNVAVFFPSYQLLSDIKPVIERSHRTVFSEHPSFTKEEREGLLDRFRGYKHTGAILLGVMGGSFSEGIDLPGDELRGVIVVGLPLARPDLETKALIDHYDKKFRRGWDFGYTYPAFNKTLQSAGRCIRTEHDRGVVVFIDERYAWQSYYSCFPKEWNIAITLKHEALIKAFFSHAPETEEEIPATD